MKRWGWVVALLGFVSVVVMPLGVGWFVWEQLPTPKDVSTFAAVFGDIVGPLFAALAFAGLIYTALMQREELGLQRQELRETREELKRAAEAQEGSEEALREQIRVARLTARLDAAMALVDRYTTQEADIANMAASTEPFEERMNLIRGAEKAKANKEAMLKEVAYVWNQLLKTATDSDG